MKSAKENEKKVHPKTTLLRKKNESYHCIFCDYFTSDKRNWKKHLKTKKHQNSERKTKEKSTPSLKQKCEVCNKEYKTRQGYLWHMKKKHPKHKKNEIISNQPQIINNYNNINNITNIDESTKNITNNINISLNVFLNDYCKDALNLEDFMKNVHFKLQDVLKGQQFVDNCVSVKLINDLKEIPITQRPIHCTDQKRKNFVVKDKEEGWIKEKGGESGKLKKEIDKLYDKAYIEFYHAYDDEHPYPQNTIMENLKQETSYKLNQKKDKHKIVGSVARSVDIKDAIDDVVNEKVDIK